MHKLHTFSVGGYVDKVFVGGYKSRVAWPAQVCTKNSQSVFEPQLVHFPTIAVGVAVDKVLVVRCGPLMAEGIAGWLKNDHVSVITGYKGPLHMHCGV